MIITNFTVRLFAPTDLRAYYISDKLAKYTLASLDMRSVAAVVGLSSSVLIAGHKWKYSHACQHILYGCACYVLLCVPGLGLVSHGLSQLGADRYMYFPVAYLVPAMASVLELPYYRYIERSPVDCSGASTRCSGSSRYVQVVTFGLMVCSVYFASISQQHLGFPSVEQLHRVS